MRPEVGFYLALMLAGCSSHVPQPIAGSTTSRAGWLDVSGKSDRYYGTYRYDSKDPNRIAVAASGVVLTLWDNRPECEVWFEGSNTLVTIKGQNRRFPGRPLLLVSPADADIEVLSHDIPLAAYSSQESMTQHVSKMLQARAGQ